MVINSRSDLKNYIDGDYGVENPWEDVLEEAASMVLDYDNCPNYGEDWRDFFNTINFSEIVIEADDSVTNQKNRKSFINSMNNLF